MDKEIHWVTHYNFDDEIFNFFLFFLYSFLLFWGAAREGWMLRNGEMNGIKMYDVKGTLNKQKEIKKKKGKV